MIKMTDSKMKATRAFINMWLKDPTLFCVNCGKRYFRRIDKHGKIHPCCNEPRIIDNWQRTSEFIAANNDTRATLVNEFACSESKAMRWSIRMPAELMRALQKYFHKEYDEEFLVDVKEGRQFMKEFPQFCIASRI